MASGPANGPPPQLQIYPAYCHKASPTYFTWVKLTAADIHNALRARRGFETATGQHPQSLLLFCLNHPVQFVCIVGVVVAFDEHFERFWLFTIDDSSGCTIDVTCRKPDKLPAKGSLQPGPTKSRGNLVDDEGDARVGMMGRIDLGSLVKVKGTVGSFREVRQVQLERLSLVADTGAEMRFWEQRTQLLEQVLSKPWTLSPLEQRRLQKEAEGEVEVSKDRLARHKERIVKKLARERKDAEKIARQYEVEEVERERYATKAKEHGAILQSKKRKRHPARPADMTVTKTTIQHREQ